MNRQRALTLCAVALMFAGLLGTVADVARWSSQPRFDVLTGPVQINGTTLRLAQTDSGRAALMLGDEVLASGIMPVPNAATDAPYHVRFGPLVSLARVAGLRTPAAVVVAPRTSPATAAQIIVLPAAAARMPEQALRDKLAANLATAGLFDARPWVVAGPLLFLMGAGLLLLARGSAFLSAPTLLLCLALLALGSVVGWPLVLVNPQRLLPVAVLASTIALAVALAAGGRFQRLAGRGSTGRRVMTGGAVGLVLLGVFVAAFVNINGFVAPVFRPPDSALSPAQWFMNDLVKPALGLFGSALVPAWLCGAVYGWRLRARGG
ncbi:MAG: hypothetical protein AAFU65_07220 [Pseudomonadota bacterium]